MYLKFMLTVNCFWTGTCESSHWVLSMDSWHLIIPSHFLSIAVTGQIHCGDLNGKNIMALVLLCDPHK